MPEQSLNYEEEEVSETDCIAEDVGAEELKEKAIASFLAIKGVGKTAAEKIWDAQYFSLMDVAASKTLNFQVVQKLPPLDLMLSTVAVAW